MASANVFQQYLKPVRSVQEYGADLDQAEMGQLTLDAARRRTALAASTQQQATEERNALRRIAASSGGDPLRMAAELRASGLPGLITQADTIEKGAIERRKGEAEAGSKEGDTLDKSIQRYRGALDFIDTPQGAARWLQAQYADPQLSKHLAALGSFEEAAGRIPTDPAGFTKWRQQAGIGMQKFLEQQAAAARDAETGRHHRATETTAAGQLSVAQGNLKTRRDELDHSKSQPKGQFLETPEGYVLADPRSGGVQPVNGPDGKPLRGKAADRALTDSQAKANLFGSRMQEADRILTQLEGKYSPMAVNAKMGAEKIPLVGGAAGYAGNLMLSEQGQQAEQAQRDFVNAILRRESGAVISDGEFANAQKQYFPQQGDTPAVIAQKRRNRQIAMEGLMAEVPEGRRGVPSLTSPANRQPSTGGATGGWGGDDPLGLRGSM